MSVTIKSIKKLGDQDLTITEKANLTGITLEKEGKGAEQTFKLTIPATLEQAYKDFEDDDEVVVDWENTIGTGANASTKTYRGINGTVKKTAKVITVSGIQKSFFALNLMTELEIKDPKAKTPAAYINVMMGNCVPGHKQGDFVIQQLKGNNSYVDLVAIINWIKGTDEGAKDLSLPPAPQVSNTLGPAEITELGSDNKLKLLYTAAATEYNETKKAEAVTALKKLADKIKTTSADEIKKDNDIVRKKLSIDCGKLSAELTRDIKIETEDKTKAEAQKKAFQEGDKRLAIAAVAAVRADASTEPYLSLAADKVTAKSIERYRVEFKNLSINFSRGLYTVDLESHDDDTIQFGPFNLKHIGVYISNNPDDIKEKYPQLKY